MTTIKDFLAKIQDRVAKMLEINWNTRITRIHHFKLFYSMIYVENYDMYNFILCNKIDSPELKAYENHIVDTISKSLTEIKDIFYRIMPHLDGFGFKLELYKTDFPKLIIKEE